MNLKHAALLLGLLSVAPPSLAADTTLYLSPKGSDQADGLAPRTPLATLQRAMDIAYQTGKAEKAAHVRILVEEGEYRGQATRVGSPPAGTHVEVAAAESARNKPVFDGAGKADTWFTLAGPTQAGATFTVRGLEIRNYRTAISLDGNRSKRDAYITGGTLRDLTLRDIGQIAMPDKPLSTAAIRLVNARRITIADNTFIRIRNIQQCAPLHAIYLAHHASDNRITGNTFDDLCGSPIRIRDASNRNQASGNTFKRAEYHSVFDEWYCDRSVNPKCTKASGECPSWGNIYSDNKVEQSNPDAMARPTSVRVQRVPPGCVPDAAGKGD
ncbi:hypothetical protein ISE1_3472 [plant metagenome]|uniref:Periplasmic copper-binding protein NosD beta helix domain-containing protein n=1 Tax=plant metagenome TaxID=1297885 RepID=A0A484SFI1_9ZZZZ